MNVFYRPAALEDIRRSASYLSDTLKNPQAAKRLKTNIMQGCALLRENPQMGTLLSSRFDGIDTNIRYLVIQKQMVFYEVTEEFVEIIRILDGRTDYLSRLFD